MRSVRGDQWGVTAVPIMIIMARSRRVMGEFVLSGMLARGGALAKMDGN